MLLAGLDLSFLFLKARVGSKRAVRFLMVLIGSYSISDDSRWAGHFYSISDASRWFLVVVLDFCWAPLVWGGSFDFYLFSLLLGCSIQLVMVLVGLGRSFDLLWCSLVLGGSFDFYLFSLLLSCYIRYLMVLVGFWLFYSISIVLVDFRVLRSISDGSRWFWVAHLISIWFR